MKTTWKVVDGMVVTVVERLPDMIRATIQVVFANVLILMPKPAKQSKVMLVKILLHIMGNLTKDALELIVLGVNILVRKERGIIAM